MSVCVWAFRKVTLFSRHESTDLINGSLYLVTNVNRGREREREKGVMLFSLWPLILIQSLPI